MPAKEYFNTVRPSADLNLLHAGCEQCKPLHTYSSIRAHYLLHYVLSGEGVFSTDTETYTLTQGGAFVVFPDQRHTYRAGAKNPWRYAWFGFRGRESRILLSAANITSDLPVMQRPFSQTIATHIDALLAVLAKRKPGFGYAADGILYQIFSELIALNSIPLTGELGKKPRAERYVEKAVHFIEANYQKPISVSEIAGYVGLERSYFSTLFRKATGKSVQEYLIGFRLARAKDLLRYPQFSITEIAEAVGYADYFNFAKIFKKKFGATVSAFREAMAARRKP